MVRRYNPNDVIVASVNCNEKKKFICFKGQFMFRYILETKPIQYNEISVL